MSAPVTEAHQNLAGAVWSSVEYHKTPHAAQLIADSEARACAELRALVGTIRSQLNLIPRNVGDITTAEHSHETGAAIDQLRAEVERLREWQAGVIANERLHHAERKEAIARAASAEREVERLKRDYDYDHKCLHEVRERCESWKQRAERAEAEMERLKPYVSKAVLTREGTMLCSPLVAVKFNEQTARAESAEAELAGIHALANRRNKRDHSQDTTHQLVAALDQALDIAQAELAQFRELDAERTRLRQLALDACRAAAIVPLVWYPEGYYVNPNDLGKINKQQVDACVAAIDAAMKEGA